MLYGYQERLLEKAGLLSQQRSAENALAYPANRTPWREKALHGNQNLSFSHPIMCLLPITPLWKLGGGLGNKEARPPSMCFLVALPEPLTEGKGKEMIQRSPA